MYLNTGWYVISENTKNQDCKKALERNYFIQQRVRILKNWLVVMLDYQWLYCGFLGLKNDLFHTLLQLIISLINALSVYQSLFAYGCSDFSLGINVLFFIAGTYIVLSALPHNQLLNPHMTCLNFSLNWACAQISCCLYVQRQSGKVLEYFINSSVYVSLLVAAAAGEKVFINMHALQSARGCKREVTTSWHNHRPL
jgi:hypothetical protein